MADEKTKVILDLDNKEFVEKMKHSLDLFGQLGKAEELGELAEKLGKIGMIVGPIIAAVLILKESMEFIKEAEEIERVNKSFEAMAESVGVAGQALREDLVKAVGGLANETDTIKAATKAMTLLGDKAARIPEIMELSRKATKVFGGDFLENFEKMSAALAAGNTRSLRQFGIIVDNEKALKEYAKSLGVGVEYISEAGKKQALMNAAMAQGSDKFKNITTDSETATQSLNKIGVSLKEMGEMAVLAWNKIAGPTVSKALKEIEEGMHTMALRAKAAFGGAEESQAATNELAEKHIVYLKQQIALTDKRFNPDQWDLYNRQLKHEEEALEKRNEADEKSMMLAMKRGQMDENKAGGSAGESGDSVDYEKLKAARTKFEQDMLKIRQDRFKSEEEIETTVNGMAKIRDQQMVDAALDASLKIQELHTNGLNKGLINQEQYAAAVGDIQRKLTADIRSIKTKANDDEIKALKNLEIQNQKTATGFRASWQKNIAQNKKDMQNMGRAADSTFNSLKSHAVAAFTAMGDGSKTGAEAVKGFMLGALGDIAMEWGTFHLINGIASYNFVEAAEGAALIALGGALSGMASGSSGGGGKSGSGGGGGGDASSLVGSPTDTASAAPEPQAKQQKAFTLAVHGSIFETEQTRNRIVDMIKQAGDITDFSYKPIGSA